jgi:serine/threonine-protein kinase
MGTRTVPGYADDWVVPGYTEERQLGNGASGRVMAAADNVTGQRVAIKYLSPALLRDPAFTWRFRAEAALQRSLDVPQIVRVFDYVEEPGRGAAIVMELVDGVSLHEMIGQRGPAGPEAALAVLKGSLLGLAAAHAAGIVHRDFKPENVLVDAHGSSKLADFGVAVQAGKKLPVAGTPLYMAPEQWNGAPSSPATDIYAATAVFFECLTGMTPFTGRLPQLRQQHETAAVPLNAITVPSLRDLIARGMAKNPADRPPGAIAFVSELESAAAATYGSDWEERGRGHLAVRAAALLPLLLAGGGTAGSSGTSTAVSWLGGHKVPHAARRVLHAAHRGTPARRKALAVASIAAAAVVVVVAGAAVALTKGTSPPAHLTGDSSAASTTLPTVQAAVLPPVAASHCTTTASFRYQGTITATAPGQVSYRWVYSSGQQGPVQTVDFAEAGHRQVTGEIVKTKTAGTGWAEVKMVRPAATTSNKAGYRLLCADGTGGVSAVAAVLPASRTVTCGTPAPAFTATGSITSRKAQTVSYYWSLSDGRVTPSATMTFTRPGTLPARPLSITPQGDPSTGEAVLVVSRPVAVSVPAPYTLSCDVPLHLAASATVSPASQALSSCTAAAPTLTFSGTVSDDKAGTVSYYWKLPGGNGPVQTLNFAKAGSQAVTAAYKPASDSASGSGSLVITSPASVTSNTAAFTVACGAKLTATSSVPATATVGAAYSGTVTVSGGNSSYTWGTMSGLPAGLTASASGATLTISGTPAAVGAATATVTVSDTETTPKTATATVAISIGEPSLVITTTALPSGASYDDYSAALSATGGTGAYTWSAAGLPGGLTVNAATGTISGMLGNKGEESADNPGTYPVIVTVKDASTSAQKQFSLVVTPERLSFDPGVLEAGISGTAYSYTVSAAGGTGPYTYSATGLPAGLAIGAATGTISGTSPTVETATTYTVTITVTDSGTPAQSTPSTSTLTVEPAPAVG